VETVRRLAAATIGRHIRHRPRRLLHIQRPLAQRHSAFDAAGFTTTLPAQTPPN